MELINQLDGRDIKSVTLSHVGSADNVAFHHSALLHLFKSGISIFQKSQTAMQTQVKCCVQSIQRFPLAQSKCGRVACSRLRIAHVSTSQKGRRQCRPLRGFEISGPGSSGSSPSDGEIDPEQARIAKELIDDMKVSTGRRNFMTKMMMSVVLCCGVGRGLWHEDGGLKLLLVDVGVFVQCIHCGTSQRVLRTPLNCF